MTIKLNFLALATLGLFLGLTSCSSDKENEDVSNGLNKNVYVKIEKPKTLGTRAESNPEVGGEVIDFNGGNLYFTSSIGLIEKHIKIIVTGEPNDSEVTIDELAEGYTFKNLPALTAKVYIVGNTDLNIESGRISAVQNTSLAIESQKDFKNVNLYGMSVLQKKVGGKDNELAANVTLAPTVSRLEIGNIKSKGNVIEGFKVEGIFVDGYVVKSDVEGRLDASNILTGADAASEFEEDSNTFPIEYNGIVYDWYSVLLASILDGEYQTVKPAGEKNIWAYNVFAEKNSKIVPRIIIRLTDIQYSNDKIVKGPLFLTAKLKFGDKYLEELEPGKIYTIGKSGIIFDETNLTPDPNQERLDVEVTVTLATWDKIDLDVEL